MPVITTTSVAAFAHCTNPRCEGYEQEPVDARATETQFLYTDNGGDWPFVERSTTSLAFANEEDAKCESCGGQREVSTQQRPQIPGLSGYSQDYLVSTGFRPFSKEKQVQVQDSRVEDLEGQVAALSGQLEAVLAALKSDSPEPEAA